MTMVLRMLETWKVSLDCEKLKAFQIECCDGIIEAVTSHSLLLAIDSSMRIDFLLSQAR